MIFITGDMHGDLARFDSPAIKRLRKEDTLIVCGDFGFVWDGSQREKKILKKLGTKKFNIGFIDGTHENFELLSSYEVTEWCGGKVHNISGNLYHLMRGQVFTIDGMTVFTMGGGESPDIDIRFEKNAWSRAEFPSREELLEGAENLEKIDCRVDYIITHEPPVKIKGFLKLKDSETASVTGLNTYLEELGEACKFRRWFFGSMHLDKYISGSHVAVFQNVINAITGEILR